MNLTKLCDELRIFAQERDWEQFHTPKNLASALIVEASELLEHFQWLKTGELAELDERKQNEIRHELADVLMYLVRLADKLDVDLMAAASEKLEHNRIKYPTEKVRGDSRKYSEY
ncbi:MAG: nucleotide pyrophosphohydrolase [Proteobacteria bacterium]|nr:nucleotide pyrophosphohydrolase [Pseudomonadota bacterium]